MKKVFQLQQENKHPDRVLESLKHEIRKYFKRERKKKLPENALYWDFDCRFGTSAEDANNVTPSELMTALDHAKAEQLQACYIEIIAREVTKSSKQQEEAKEEGTA